MAGTLARSNYQNEGQAGCRPYRAGRCRSDSSQLSRHRPVNVHMAPVVISYPDYPFYGTVIQRCRTKGRVQDIALRVTGRLARALIFTDHEPVECRHYIAHENSEIYPDFQHASNSTDYGRRRPSLHGPRSHLPAKPSHQ